LPTNTDAACHPLILGVHHVQITIPRGAEAAGRQFYCHVLGLSEVEKPASLAGRGGFWLQFSDGRQLHVGTEDGVDRAATKAHVALAVTSLPVWRRTLAAAGVTLLDNAPIPGFDRFEFRDPFGNRVEMIEPAPAGGPSGDTAAKP
jgi:catechol 2,3-dioxygenase-like lactoylglutathione lyase family enzyme